MIYLEVNFSMFCDQFARMGRKDQFTYEGKKVLWDYLSEIHYADSNKWELDVIALCCDWAEYTEEELMKNYNYENKYASFEKLKEQIILSAGTLLETEGNTFVVPAF